VKLHSQRSPDAALLHFIERLPTTIREVVLARCCQAFGRLQLTQHQDLFATFRAIVMAAEPEARAYACARMIAVLELTLHDEFAETHSELARELEKAPCRPAGSFDLRTPLAQKHWQGAREEFFNLRKDALGTESLYRMLVQPLEGRRPAGLER
jgi:hypothetical protein